MKRLGFITACLLCAISPTCLAQEVRVHFAGEVKKPGAYKVASPISLDDLIKACGGIGVFGTTRRIKVIRLAHPMTKTTGPDGKTAVIEGEPSNVIFELDQVPRKDGKLLLKSEDVIFIFKAVVFGK